MTVSASISTLVTSHGLPVAHRSTRGAHKLATDHQMFMVPAHGGHNSNEHGSTEGEVTDSC